MNDTEHTQELRQKQAEELADTSDPENIFNESADFVNRENTDVPEKPTNYCDPPIADQLKNQIPELFQNQDDEPLSRPNIEATVNVEGKTSFQWWLPMQIPESLITNYIRAFSTQSAKLSRNEAKREVRAILEKHLLERLDKIIEWTATEAAKQPEPTSPIRAKPGTATNTGNQLPKPPGNGSPGYSKALERAKQNNAQSTQNEILKPAQTAAVNENLQQPVQTMETVRSAQPMEAIPAIPKLRPQDLTEEEMDKLDEMVELGSTTADALSKLAILRQEASNKPLPLNETERNTISPQIDEPDFDSEALARELESLAI